MKPLLTLLLLFLFSTALLAHNGSIRGSVLDAETKSPLAGANVWLENTELQAYTDDLGYYQFEDLTAGSYSVRISYLGYEVFSATVEVRDSETTPLRSLMVRTAIQLQTVEVSPEPDIRSRAISSLDIHLRPTETSQDILRLVPGLFIAQHAGGGKAEQIFLRGFDIDHGTDIAINVDGIPVNMVSHAHGQGYADLHFLIPETVERVQFGKGPYYASYGNLATAGYAGFQTKNGIDRSTLSLQAGQFDTYRAMGMFKLMEGAYVATEYFFSNGYFDSPQAYNRFSVFGKYSGAVGEKHYLSASASSFSSRWDASGQIPQRAVDSGRIGYFGAIDDTEGGSTSRTNLNLHLSSFLEDGSTIRNQFYYSKYDFELYSNFTFFLNDPLNGDQIKQKESRDLIGYQGAYTRSDKWLGANWKTEAGLQFRHDASSDNELSHTLGRQTILERKAYGDIDETNIGLYLSETVRFSRWFTLNGALRFDQFHFLYVDKLRENYQRDIATANLFSPKLNAYFTLSDRFQLFALSGYGFHSNDTRVAVVQKGRQILPRALGLEGGALWKPASRLLLSASAWYLNLEQEFVYVGDEAVVEAGGETDRRGLDLSARIQLLDWLFADLDLNYTFARSADTPSEEAYIPLAAAWTSIGGLNFQTRSGFNGSLRYRYLGDRPANETNSVVAEGYVLVDALLNYTRPSWELGLSVQNLLDERWKEAQFDTESRLQDETEPVSEIHFTPGQPFNLRAHVAFFF
ncbi:MAG: TonB-dependent receptor [Saprospirales bacterium]|nr:TonB-dependent receptor [Saprospirales bacterium]